MSDMMIAILSSFVGGGALVALIGFLDNRLKYKETRKAAQEDLAAEKEDKVSAIRKDLNALKEKSGKKNSEVEDKLDTLQKMQEAQSEALKLILLDRILHLGQGYINKGEVSFDDRKRLHEMHDCYHKDLLGNGDADLIMSGVDAIPLKK